MGEVTAPGITAGAPAGLVPAGMLPKLPVAVPMEAELRQLPANFRGGRLLELHPHPAAHDLGPFVEVGPMTGQQMHQAGTGEEAIAPTKAEINRWQRGAGGLFGAAGEPCKRE